MLAAASSPRDSGECSAKACRARLPSRPGLSLTGSAFRTITVFAPSGRRRALPSARGVDGADVRRALRERRGRERQSRGKEEALGGARPHGAAPPAAVFVALA